MKLILASGSPRRKELMEQMELEFTVDKETSFQEVVPQGMAPADVPAYFAQGKALGFHRPLQDDEVLVSADTIVICEGCIMGKPQGREGAVQMLRQLSGKSHQVVSAVSVRSKERQITLSDTADVVFRSLSEAEMEHYVSRYNPTDKAGAYGIQEWIGLVGIESIKGSFYTIMGLPTHLLYRLLQEI